MRFRTIVADPPWTFKNPRAFSSGSWGINGTKTGGDFTRTSRVAAGERYTVLTLDDIKALPVGDVAEADSYLWLWSPSQHVLTGHAVEVAQAWGYEVKGARVWAKDRFGVGYWLRYAHEHLLLCTRGKPGPLLNRGLSSVLRTPRTKHSQKPDLAYSDIEGATPGPFLDLFARAPRDGWTVWGDEVGDPLGWTFDPEKWRTT